MSHSHWLLFNSDGPERTCRLTPSLTSADCRAILMSDEEFCSWSISRWVTSEEIRYLWPIMEHHIVHYLLTHGESLNCTVTINTREGLIRVGHITPTSEGGLLIYTDTPDWILMISPLEVV